MGVIRTIELSEDEVEAERQLAEAGVDAGAIFRAGLEASLQKVFTEDAIPVDEATLTRWLRKQVLPVLEADEADPSGRISSEQLRRDIDQWAAAWEQRAAD